MTSDKRAPLSAGQRRLEFLHRMAPAVPLYTCHVDLDIEGPLDVEALERSLAQILERHEVLRSVLVDGADQTRHVLLPSSAVVLRRTDLSGLEPEVQARELRAHTLAQANEPFDLQVGPLVRMHLLRRSSASHLLALSFHHIVIDAGSMGLFLRELTTLYRAFIRGEASPLSPVPMQYAEVARREAEWLAGPECAHGRLYWRETLRELPVLRLPSDRPAPEQRSFVGAVERFELSAELVAKLDALARELGATRFDVLLSVFALLLSRYTGQSDFGIGTNVTHRPQAELRELIGFFVNTLVIRCNLEGDPSFRRLIERINATKNAGRQHAGVPFEEVVAELGMRRSGAIDGSIRANFVKANIPRLAVDIPEMRFYPRVHVDGGAVEGSAKFDLGMIICDADDGGVTGTVEYSVELFEAETIARLVGHYRGLIESVSGNPDAPVSRAVMVLGGEADALLRRASSRGAWAVEDTLVERFAVVRREHPNRRAVGCGGESLSYAELDERANQLAHWLRGGGVGAESLVAVCLGRSIDLIVAVLAVLKAGGAYVPLDADHPAERVVGILVDCGASTLITSSELLKQVGLSAPRVIVIDRDREQIARQPREAPELSLLPENLAYVIFTSGSTGRPKGVAVPHANVLRLFDATRSSFEFSPDDVWSLFHSIAFDFSVWELWGALLYGGCVVVVEHAVSRSPEAFRRLLVDERVTVLSQTPAAFRLLIESDRDQAQGDLAVRTVVFGGEALDTRALIPWFDRHGDARPSLINMYGITETTVHVTHRPVHVADTRRPGSLIGEQIDDLELHVLDASGQPSPLGVPGELFVGGPGLARGYLGRPALTAERFVPNPFAKQPGGRLYRTGDRARRLPGGDIEYLGRIDHQVQIRGFRVELGEVEAALRRIEGVGECLVLSDDEGGEVRLIAYLIASSSETELRRRLRAMLPDYMVPAHLVLLASFPLTPQGKLDRRALPKPIDVAAERPSSGAGGLETNPVQSLLADIWCEVLGLSQVGIDDSFFDLGGDSIRAIQLMARVRASELASFFTLQQLFALQTIRALSQLSNASDEVWTASSALELLDAGERAWLPAGIEDAYPLARLQAGMLYHSEREPETGIYHDVFSWHVEAAFDEASLREAAAALVVRHELLRTSFDYSAPTRPLQLVHARAVMQLGIEDLRGLPAAEHDAVIEAWMQSERVRAFDWRRAPLLRLFVHQRSATTFQLSFSFHHAILDGWSLASLSTELLEGYAAQRAGDAVPVGVAALPYREFIAAEQRMLGSAAVREFWLARLDGAPVARLPRPSTPPHSTTPGVKRTVLDADLGRTLRRRAAEVGVPLKTLLLTAHLRVLSMVSGQRDVVSGYVSNARPEVVGSEATIGLFLNTLPLRLALGRETWAELAKRVFRAELELVPHRGFPLAEIQRLRGGDALFEVAFNYIHFHVYERVAAIPGVALRGQKVFEKTDFALNVHFHVEAQSELIELALHFDERSLEAELIDRIAGYYAAAIRSIAERPDARHDTCSLATDSEIEQLGRFGAGEVGSREDAFVHDLFFAQALRTPDVVAVRKREVSLSYAQLSARVRGLAARLIALGIGPEVRVGICLERSPEFVVAMMAVLAAGGAYVPLDPVYPEARLRFMIEDAGLHVVLRRSDLDLDLDDTATLDELPSVSMTAQNLAYVIYTSGSTGRPKGVAVTHAGLANYARWAIAAYGEGLSGFVPSQLSPSFDASVTTLLLPLLCGGTIQCVDDLLGDDPLAEVVVESKRTASLLKLTPSQLRSFPAGALDRLPKLTLVLGGEQLAGEHLRAVASSTTLERVVNEYGPTETVVGCAVYSATLDLLERSGPIAIGRPIANTTLHVLAGPDGPRCPIGVAGELFIAGAGVSRGYLGRPSLTAERFVPDVFGSPGARMYRTGDLCRWRADGNLEYLGRLDDQVKVRGFRIELGEIEAALSEHASVSRCAVMVRAGASEGEGEGEGRLVAYIVPAGVMPTTTALREHLAARLPNHMLPELFVELAALPVSITGKLDRHALPAPDRARPQLAVSYVAPHGVVQLQLARIFMEVLQLEQIGIHDSFFDAGGHSLTATQAVSRIRDAFSLALPLSELFAHPTIAALETRLAAATSVAKFGSAIVPVERERSLELSFAEQRLWFLNQMRPDSAWYNVTGSTRFCGTLDLDALRRTFTKIALRHEILRTNYVAEGGHPRRVIHASQPWPMPVVELARDGLDAYVRAQLERPFDLARDPLLRTTLIRLASDEHLLLINLHHIVSDGWSMGVLWRELGELYAAEVEQRATTLLPLEIQYADFAAWQRRAMEATLDVQLHYWTERLAGLPTLVLPTTRPRPPIQSFRGDMIERPLADEVHQGLLALGREHDATLFMTMLAAWATILARHADQRDFAIGTAIANRNQRQLEGLIGFFVNTLVLRIDLAGDPDVATLLEQVRGTTLAAYDHQDLPFERLVDELKIERDLSRMPLVQVMFVLQNAPDSALSLPGVDVEVQPIYTRTTKFDLTLYGTETPNGLMTGLEYNADIFDREAAERLLAQLHVLLGSMVESPRGHVLRLPLLPDRERAQVIEGWNPGRRLALATGIELCAHERFIEQARSSPQRIALICGDETFTYGELARRAERVAAQLQAKGVGPGDFVGLLSERTPAVIVGLLGVLLAGAAYVPLDPHYPRERLAFMAEDARLSALVVTPSLIELAPTGVAQIELRPELWEVDTAIDLQPVHVRPEHAAYVIYTSGSTGRPKGVVVEHRNLLRLFTTAGAQVPYGPDEVWSLFHSIAFDFSVWELWGALLFGGRVILVPHDVSRSPEQFHELVVREGVTVLSQTPSAFESFMRADLRAEAGRHRIKVVVFGGEALDPLALREWAAAQRSCPTLLNMYGITETTVHVTQQAIGAADFEHRSSPIGRALEDMTVYLLDVRGEPVPIGVRGEVYVGGRGVSRGYLGQPALTAARFVPDPFGPPGARMYRAGDLARWRSDGVLEFLGRIDDQIQLRGFRVELGEIESRLAEHPALAAQVVVARRDDSGVQRLAAYVVADPEHPLSELLDASDDWRSEQVDHWQSVYDENYERGADNLEFDITGWNDSYTGQAIPPAQMRYWVEQTVERVLARAPRRVLEIGCGTGLILLRVAPRVERYVGIDISRVVLDRLAQVVSERGLEGVELHQGRADDLSAVADQKFDLVVVNSVIQYFPELDYLLQMIERAIERVAHGGALFLGDLRNLPTLEAFHAGVQFGQAAERESRGSLRRRVSAQLLADEELVIDPKLFAALVDRFERVAAVSVQLKRGRDENELTRHRYDVLLHLDVAPVAAEAPTLLAGIRDAQALREALLSTRADAVSLRGPNPRMTHEIALVEWLGSDRGPATVGAMREQLQASGLGSTLDPETAVEVAEALGWRAALSWCSDDAAAYDAVFVRASTTIDASVSTPIATRRERIESPAAWRRLTNDPLHGRRSRALALSLRRWLETRLPGYMIPSSFTVLRELPLTPSGKIDRKGLPAPEGLRPELEIAFVPPRTPMEQLVCGLWCEVLGLDRVGLDDDFFSLGGHSLLATQLVSRVRRSLGAELPLRSLFEAPTVRALVGQIEAARRADMPVLVAAEHGGRAPLSFAQQRMWFPRATRAWDRAVQRACCVSHRGGARCRGARTCARAARVAARGAAHHVRGRGG